MTKKGRQKFWYMKISFNWRKGVRSENFCSMCSCKLCLKHALLHRSALILSWASIPQKAMMQFPPLIRIFQSVENFPNFSQKIYISSTNISDAFAENLKFPPIFAKAVYSPLFRKINYFPLVCKIYHRDFVEFTCFLHALRVFCFPLL